METNIEKKALRKERAADTARRAEVKQRVASAAAAQANDVYALLGSSPSGLDEERADDSRDEYGTNTVTRGEKPSVFKRLWEAFINPFSVVLLVLAGVSAVTDIFLAAPGSEDPVMVIVIAVMVIISGTLRFVQETKSGNAAAALSDMIKTTACVERQDAGKREIPLDEIAVGDVVYLAAGDWAPADVRIVSARDMFVSQSALTGESEPVEKSAEPCADASAGNTCIAYMGSAVVSGSAKAVVVAVGNDTMLGDMARHLTSKPPMTNFDKGVNSVTWVLIRFMLVMAPVVFVINGIGKGNWLEAGLFAISVAVGLTPEMLPMIVTTCLAKGAVAMSKEKVIIKNLSSIQNLGSMDVLCTDKTGTLTQDKVVLEYHLDVNGKEDDRVLRHAFLNSYYQTGLKNLMDIAIIEHTKALEKEKPEVADLEHRYHKVDEIPFDFERRRMSVVVADQSGKTQMITKGAIEEMLRISTHVEYDGRVTELTQEERAFVLGKVSELNRSGMRVLGVAQKTNPSPVGAFSVSDESDMVLIGYLAFLDPPKETTAAAIKALRSAGVSVKILTGDNEKVTECICSKVGLSVDRVLFGSDVSDMDDESLRRECENVTVFAKLSPTEKARVVTALRANGHSVGYMGDGINDATAMKASDVGISVDTAVDIARESASVILLEKDLMVLEKGIIEGRRTYANMIKYIKMTASSNFGNMFSVLAASAFLPFLPMTPIHLILLNLIYTTSCAAIPWDNVDAEFLARPRSWDADSIGRFMVWMGPVSSIFDIVTYLLMFFVICPGVCGGAFESLSAEGRLLFASVFQTGWFIESMWSQTLVIHMIRTPKLPFIQSRASWQVTCATTAGIAVLTCIPFLPLGALFGLHPLPAVYFAWLAVIVLVYVIFATVVKKLYIRRYGELL